jgi:hypothetical protein
MRTSACGSTDYLGSFDRTDIDIDIDIDIEIDIAVNVGRRPASAGRHNCGGERRTLHIATRWS